MEKLEQIHAIRKENIGHFNSVLSETRQLAEKAHVLDNELKVFKTS